MSYLKKWKQFDGIFAISQHNTNDNPGWNQFLFRSEHHRYGASVVYGGRGIYGDGDSFEIAIVKFSGGWDYRLTYDTPITNDVIAYCEPDEVRAVLEQIASFNTFDLIKIAVNSTYKKASKFLDNIQSKEYRVCLLWSLPILRDIALKAAGSGPDKYEVLDRFGMGWHKFDWLRNQYKRTRASE